ncbi:hypothetical protein C9439_03810 [archaeon SCG-AAA382B04]|nr:hypothetical protein C9439_03810 [archaeon SCG-AAA382B04]
MVGSEKMNKEAVPRQEKLIKERDWDILIILDACRYDVFLSIYEEFLKGDLTRVKSPAAATEPWLNSVFENNYSDTIYVSGNPHVSQIGKKNFRKIFFKVEDVWDYGWEKINGIPTVPPQNISQKLIENLVKFPEKKIIAHYMQPHAPYVGNEKLALGGSQQWLRKRAKEEGILGILNSKIPKKAKNIIGSSLLGKAIDRIGIKMSKNEWNKDPIGMKDAIDRYGLNKVKRAYQENLKLVLNDVKSNLEKVLRFKEKVVISSDHGDLFGEKGLYGHPKDSGYNQHPELYHVPWLEVENDEFR